MSNFSSGILPSLRLWMMTMKLKNSQPETLPRYESYYLYFMQFRVYFKVQQQADVLAFAVSNFKSHVVPDASVNFADYMMDFSRTLNHDIDDLRKQKQSEISQKQLILTELDSMVKLNEKREQILLQKMSLVLNSKKQRILELKMQVDELSHNRSS